MSAHRGHPRSHGRLDESPAGPSETRSRTHGPDAERGSAALGACDKADQCGYRLPLASLTVWR